MPRRPRQATGGYVFHVLNRAAAQRTLFGEDGDYSAFLGILNEAQQQVPMRVLSYCVMPNHWHLVLWPTGDDDLSEYMKWLTTTHAQRWHKWHESTGTGALYQGRLPPGFETEAELAALRKSVTHGIPFGDAEWGERTGKALGIETRIRPAGRPRTRW